MGHFVTGVTVVTALDGEQPFGITVNALSSVSLDPPLVMVALDRRRFLTPIVRAAGRYAVNVLSEDQQALSDCFAGAPVEPGRQRFCGAAWHAGADGLPLIDGAIATLECTSSRLSAGDHDLFIGGGRPGQDPSTPCRCSTTAGATAHRARGDGRGRGQAGR